MTSKELTYQYRMAVWSENMKERTELGMSIRAYCAMKGFAENTYYYWQRRLRDAVCNQLEVQQTSLPAADFTRVTMASASEAPVTECQGGQLHVQIKGIHLSVDSSYPPEQLAALLLKLQLSC